MSDSVRPHRRQPTRLPRPWDSAGKNTGVGCHFLLQCMKVKSEREVTQSCPTLSDPMDYSLPGSSFHGIFQARVLGWGAIAFSAFPLGTGHLPAWLSPASYFGREARAGLRGLRGPHHLIRAILCIIFSGAVTLIFLQFLESRPSLLNLLTYCFLCKIVIPLMLPLASVSSLFYTFFPQKAFPEPLDAASTPASSPCVV